MRIEPLATWRGGSGSVLILLCLLLQSYPMEATSQSVQKHDDQTVTALSKTRAEEALAIRRQLLASVKPAKPSRAIELLDTIENDGFDQLVTVQLRHWRIGVGKISPVSSLTPALQYERPWLGEAGFRLLASGAYSLRGYQAYDLRFGKFEAPAPYSLTENAYLGDPFECDRRSLAVCRTLG